MNTRRRYPIASARARSSIRLNANYASQAVIKTDNKPKINSDLASLTNNNPRVLIHMKTTHPYRSEVVIRNGESTRVDREW